MSCPTDKFVVVTIVCEGSRGSPNIQDRKEAHDIVVRKSNPSGISGNTTKGIPSSVIRNLGALSILNLLW